MAASLTEPHALDAVLRKPLERLSVLVVADHAHARFDREIAAHGLTHHAQPYKPDLPDLLIHSRFLNVLSCRTNVLFKIL